MELQTGKRERKVAAGIALRPSLWNRIEHVAGLRGKPRNQVIEEVLDQHIPAPEASKNLALDVENSGEAAR